MIENWDDAYDNRAHIEGSADYPEKWAAAALQFRQMMTNKQLADLDIAYGDGERQRLDIFRPEGNINGLVVFIHGGYWRAFDKSCWSHLSGGATRRGWAVAMPSFDLVPAVSIREITRQVGSAISKAASLTDGPIRLTGHSAGGHLVTRMICRDSPLAPEVKQRIDRVISISGLHDLRPLLDTKMNDDFQMTESEAAAESPALNQPIENVELVCWVGADERPEFIRQSELLANIWFGLGIKTSVHQAKDQHHFNVIDGLVDPQSALTCTLLD
ncbi:MAG: alpha/beta hydrolase [Gammaproteobacteria bacterium]|nr:alpha/beta hydrolase [Gammaproteobacteria bacterium]